MNSSRRGTPAFPICSALLAFRSYPRSSIVHANAQSGCFCRERVRAGTRPRTTWPLSPLTFANLTRAARRRLESEVDVRSHTQAVEPLPARGLHLLGIDAVLELRLGFVVIGKLRGPALDQLEYQPGVALTQGRCD